MITSIIAYTVAILYGLGVLGFILLYPLLHLQKNFPKLNIQDSQIYNIMLYGALLLTLGTFLIVILGIISIL